jgi:hypothetical protein
MTANRDQESLIDIADALQQIQLTVQALTFDELYLVTARERAY